MSFAEGLLLTLKVLTGRIPYAEIADDVQFYLATGRGELPGNVAFLLPSNAEGGDPAPARTLRFLFSALPECWDFDPQNRPSICTLLSHLSDLSSPTEVEATSANTKAQQVLSNPCSRRDTSFVDRFSPKISAQPLNSLVWIAVLIFSLSANIFLLLRRVDTLPPREQEASRLANQDRDLYVTPLSTYSAYYALLVPATLPLCIIVFPLVNVAYYLAAVTHRL